MEEENSDKILLSHHKQQSLCTTRLPYRQGRKLTAVKVYSITKESNHLLIFGVPSINLRQETKSLFIKFGKLLQFNISNHSAEHFTETYHAHFEKIQSARVAKRMLDTKNFYGGILHICYAPELENVDETRQKLIQRQRDVRFRLKNLKKEVINENEPQIKQEAQIEQPKKINMGEINIIKVGKNTVKQIQGVVGKRRKITDKDKETEFKPCFVENKKIDNNLNENISNRHIMEPSIVNKLDVTSSICTEVHSQTIQRDIEIVDCTSADTAVVTNINEHLNYNKFGSEVIKKVPTKALNKIKFYVNKNL